MKPVNDLFGLCGPLLDGYYQGAVPIVFPGGAPQRVLQIITHSKNWTPEILRARLFVYFPGTLFVPRHARGWISNIMDTQVLGA